MSDTIRYRNRYSTDTMNRLIIRRNRKTLITDGRFSIDKNNRLIYWLNAPDPWRRQYSLPPKISFQGNWQLNPNYDLEIILDKARGQSEGDILVLKGELISTDRDTLAFSIKSIDNRGQTHIQLLKLSGSWQADEYNRISFAIKKKISPDILTLEGIWQINKNQQIVYTYEQTDLKTKTKHIRSLTFSGFWQIDNAKRLTYILEHSTKSQFYFRVQLESPNLYPQEGVIKYRLGIGLKGLSPSKLIRSSAKGTVPTKVISLYGTWKFSRKAGLSFEMDYGSGKLKRIEFGADIYLTKKDEVTLSITNKRKEPLGIFITFTHKFLKRYVAETFLRLKTSEKEKRLEAGLRIPF